MRHGKKEQVCEMVVEEAVRGEGDGKNGGTRQAWKLYPVCASQVILMYSLDPSVLALMSSTDDGQL